MFIRTEFNYDMDAASKESGLDCGREREDDNVRVSMAKQSFAEECDINTIVKRFGLTGQLPENIRQPSFVDLENAVSFHEAMNVIREAEESFMAMPAHVRARFGNDAMQFADFCSNGENLEEAKKLGLVKAEVLAAAAAGVPGASAEPAGGAVAPGGAAAAGGSKPA